MMKDPAVREVVLLFEAVKNNHRFPAAAAAMLRDGKLLCADHLAWLAYRSGKYEDSLLFLAMVADDSPIKLWLQAKFARRHGDYKASAELLRRWLKIFEQAKDEGRLYFNDDPYNHKNYLKFSTVVNGELGYTLVHEKDFSEALYTFMKADSWTDGACVAEQLMPLPELIAFVKNHCQEEKSGTFSAKLRHLLARRLLRDYQLDEAVKWFPAEQRKNAAEYVRLFRIGNDVQKNRNERAVAFYNLGKLVRQYGPVLLATEHEPDYFISDCDFESSGLKQDWYKNAADKNEDIYAVPDFYHLQDRFAAAALALSR